MKVLVLHSEVFENSGEDEQDVLVQMEAVSGALSELGHVVSRVAFSIDTLRTIEVLRSYGPDLVFNLVETVEGSGRLIYSAPGLLDHLGINYTGARTEAVFSTSNKLIAKKLLQGAGILTPAWHVPEDALREAVALDHAWIIKSVWEHASIGLEEDSVILARDSHELCREMERRRQLLGGDCFAESYIEGREFNLSLLAADNAPEILPPAEIRFDHFPQGKPTVVGYRAKWETGSFEYHHTPRCFDFTDADSLLLLRLREIATACWRCFGLRGYARVDFRVDEAGTPWVLEINTNPCLAPDAGFFAASQRAGLSYRQLVARIVADANSSWKS